MAAQKGSIIKPSCELVGMNYDPRGQKTPLIMGIDPGFSGALCVVEISTLKIIDMIDMPTYATQTAARKSGEMIHLDVHSLSAKVDFYAPLTRLSVLEDVMAMPEQGLSSTFRFGQVYGQIHGVLAGHYIPVIPAKPFVWKVALGLSRDKKESREMASKIYMDTTPGSEKLWGLQRQADRAEAALLAYYGIKYMANLLAAAETFSKRESSGR